MNMKILQTGMVQLEKDLLGGGLENWSLRLFATSHTPAVTDTLSTYASIEASHLPASRKDHSAYPAGHTLA